MLTGARYLKHMSFECKLTFERVLKRPYKKKPLHPVQQVLEFSARTNKTLDNRFLQFNSQFIVEARYKMGQYLLNESLLDSHHVDKGLYIV